LINNFDSNIPGLTTALNVDQMSEILEKTLHGLGCRLELISLKIYNIDYIPGERCRILYKIRFRHPQTGRYTRQLISARLLILDEEIPSIPEILIRKYKEFEKENSVLPVPVFYIEKIRMIVFSFPLDLRLPWCFNLLNSSSLKLLLKRRWPKRHIQLHSAKIDLLGYTPQTRAAFFIKIHGKDLRTGATDTHKLIGKIHSFKPASKRFADSVALGKSLDGHINLATPMGYIASENLSLQEEVDGKRLSDFVDSGSFKNMVQNTARAIAKVHNISVPISTTRTAKKEAAVVHRWTNLLEAVCPETSGLVRHLRSRLSYDIENSAQIEGIVHGDFHHSNILVGDDYRITLIDLDELSWGDPMLDVGRLMASLRVPALRIFGDITGLKEMQEAFLEEYMTVAGGNEKRIRLFEAVSLLISAGTPFRIQRPAWKEQTALLLNESEKALKKAESCGTSVLKSKSTKKLLSLEERIQWAQDKTYMLPIIDRHINEKYQADVLTCRVSSDRKTKRSYKIKYSLTGLHGKEKWKMVVRGIITKGSSRSQFQILETLQNNGINSDSLVLPYPVAYISPLSMLLLEVPSGASMSSMIGKQKSFEMAEKLGSGLASFHNYILDPSSNSSFQDELDNLSKRIQGLRTVSADLYSNANKIFSDLQKQSGFVTEKTTPVLRTLHPNYLVCFGQNIAFTNFEEVSFSHPLIDVGNFLASLTLFGIENDKSNAVSEISRVFYTSYEKTIKDCDSSAGLFEANALLKIICQQVKESDDDTTIYALLDHAEQRLS
jgi:aminoglycoside phosphotransferase (APT) family kinase protein